MPSSTSFRGKDTTELKMSKPALTPIVMNREMSSDFLKEIQSSNVKPIEPVFLDYNKDLTIFNTKKSNIPVLYKKNETNGLFELTYVFDMGNRHNRLLGTAAQYLDLLGTKDMTAEQIKNELYRLGCTFFISPAPTASMCASTDLARTCLRPWLLSRS